LDRAGAETRPNIRHQSSTQRERRETDRAPRRPRTAPTPRTQDQPGSTGFDRFPLSTDVRRGVDAAGFTEPRPIQVAAIPAGLAGSDVLGLAQTGTGKTAAFVLPILERLLAGDAGRGRRTGPRALIVAPTRELAAQIHAELGVLAQFTPITATTVFGGVNQNPQVRALRAGPDVVVACPGRLLDLMGQRAVSLDAVEVLVLDEADHMFDLGFLPSIRKIVAACPARRQNLLFSATMPPEIRRLADGLLHDPEVVELNHSSPADTIEHALYPCAEDRKIELLQHLVGDADFTSGIVFLRTKHRAKRLAQKLDREGHAAVALQGNMSQPQREKAMRGFRDGTYDVLVATDIAARGIDVAGVSHVINFDVPLTPDAYTHRIGRTGRSEQSGRAMTFVTDADHELVRAIERRLGTAIRRVRVEGFGGERRAGERAGAGSRQAGRSGDRAGAGGRQPARGERDRAAQTELDRRPGRSGGRGGRRAAHAGRGSTERTQRHGADRREARAHPAPPSPQAAKGASPKPTTAFGAGVR
jgi:ATP-dependent RNA helicase RhlE